jgi:hypothetical protein
LVDPLSEEAVNRKFLFSVTDVADHYSGLLRSTGALDDIQHNIGSGPDGIVLLQRRDPCRPASDKATVVL